MRVMVLVKATGDSEAGTMPSTEMLEAMGRYNEALMQAGILLAGEGLQPSAKGKRVASREAAYIITDILAGNTPYIFVKHVYACASLLGATVCALLWRIVPSYVAMLTGMLCVLILRLLSAYFRWNLPHTDDKI